MLKWLKEILGDLFTEEIGTKVEQRIGEEYVIRKDYEDLEGVKKQLEQQVAARDTQIAGLKKADPQKLQEEITRLQRENKDAKTAYEAQQKKDRIDAAVDLAMVTHKALNPKAVRALLDLEKAELEEDGRTVKGLEKQLKDLTAAEDSKMLFDTSPQGQFRGLKSLGSFQGPDGQVDVANMSYEELADYMAAYPGAEI